MGRVQATPQAKSSRFWFTLGVALLVGGLAVKAWDGMGDIHAPVPSPTVSVSDDHAHDCKGPADSHCWEYQDEETTGPRVWRFTPRATGSAR
jgi:hypothetical protein